MTVSSPAALLPGHASDLASAVTVVVPTHDRPELMREAVQSVVDQTYTGPIEIIVVFDGCLPVLPDVVLGTRHSLRALVNDRVGGLAGARNTGIVAASHDFVAFLDDDDRWMPGKLVAQMDVFERCPEAGLVGTEMQVDDGHRKHARLVPPAYVTHTDLIRDRVAGLHSSSFVFRRSILVDSLGMIDEDLPGAYGEDYDILLRAARIAPVRVVNESLVTVRWSGQSFFYGKWAQYAESLVYLLDKHPQLRSDPRAHARIGSQIGFALAASGRRTDSRVWLRDALRVQPFNVRAWLGLMVSYRLMSARGVARVATSFGRGI